MTKDFEEICNSVICEPEKHVGKLKKLLNSKDQTVCLTVANVFVSICPLYKIKTHSNKVKHKNDQNVVTEHDKTILDFYTIFLKNVLNNKDAEFTYNIAAYLLEELDHFNFNDRLVNKVIEGTKNEKTKNVCINILKNKIQNDVDGEVLFYIMDRCLDTNFSYLLVEYLLESNFLQTCVKKRIEKENKYEKQVKDTTEKKEYKKDKAFYKRDKLVGSKDKKEEKQRYLKEKKVKQKQDEELEEIDYTTYVKCINALQRLYFTLLKEKNNLCIISVCKGIGKYFRIIRQEFHEGLMFLLYENIIRKQGAFMFLVNTEIIKTVFVMFKDAGIEFSKLIDIFYEMLDCSCLYELSAETTEQNFDDLLRIVFINVKQQQSLALKFMRRLLQLHIMYRLPVFSKYVQLLSVKYDIEFADQGIFEYFLYKKMLP